ncbi:MAG: protein translocase SEC61 complex subunit gamma [Methanomassiliicoccaceae archaeon]|nr:protein translocase SEC61 complex subunit gamma [Methanomassiliicoccaceae archaeon]
MSIEEKATEVQDELESKFRNIGKGRYGRVLRMARRPEKEQYKKVLLITGIGILILGAAGFAIMWIMNYLPGFF